MSPGMYIIWSRNVVPIFFLPSQCTVKSSMWIYFYIFLVIWTRCYNTSVAGDEAVIWSSQVVLAKVGDDVILPCHIKPPVNASMMTVVWSRPDLKPEYVHVLQDGRVISHSNNQLYKQRTSLFAEELPHGNISLKLFRMQLLDMGTFQCFVPYLHSSCWVQLIIGSPASPTEEPQSQQNRQRLSRTKSLSPLSNSSEKDDVVLPVVGTLGGPIAVGLGIMSVIMIMIVIMVVLKRTCWKRQASHDVEMSSQDKLLPENRNEGASRVHTDLAMASLNRQRLSKTKSLPPLSNSSEKDYVLSKRSVSLRSRQHGEQTEDSGQLLQEKKKASEPPTIVPELTCFTWEGVNYRGEVATTISGKTCQSWSDQTPHKHDQTPENHPHEGLDNNYCRNPDNERMPWCYTTDSRRRWEFCPVPRCDVAPRPDRSIPEGAWIGMERNIFGWEYPMTWDWVSGAPVDNLEAHRHESFPMDRYNKYCGKITSELKWLDGCCCHKLPFICQGGGH